MAPSLKVFVLVSCLASALILVSQGKLLRTISVEEYHNLAGSTSGSFVAVHFDNAASRRHFPHFLREFRKAVDALDSYGIELLRLDCKGVDDNECRETNVYTFRNGVQEDSLGLDVIFNEDSIISNLLQLMLKNEIEFVSNKERFKEIIQTAKQLNKKVAFSYVRGYGNAEHAVFTKLAFVFAEVNKYDFVVTTNKNVAAEIQGLSTKDGGSLAVHICSGIPSDSDEPCKVYTPLKFTTVQAAQFLQLLMLPKYEHLADNGTSSYDSLPLSVNKAYIFTDGSDLNDEEGLKSLTDELYGKAGVIIVDVKKHKDKLSQFGLSEKRTFPTGAFVPASPEKAQPYVELFPEQNILFNFENFKHQVVQYLRHPKKQYKFDASSSSLQSITFDELEKIKSLASSFMTEKKYLMVAFCEKGSMRSECRDFCKEYRRVVRTFDRREAPEVAFVHVTLSNGGDNEIGTPKRPHIRFVSEKSGEDNFIIYDGTPDYNGMMDFLEKQTKLSSITRLSPSNSDEVPITAGDAMDKQTESDIEAVNESEAFSNSNEESEESDPPPPPEETEDDEVAGSVWRSEPPTVPEDKVPSLTDKTFQPTRDNNDLLVVNFFQPWDVRSQALVGPYVEAALHLGNIDVGKLSIRLVRVNCFDWTDVCQKNNITTYPTIKLYRKGSDEYVYKGPLDSDHLVKTVLMLQTSSPVKLESNEQVESFLTGKHPNNADKTSHVSVLGMFSADNGKEFAAFANAAEQLRGLFIFAFVSGKDAVTISTTYGVKTPGILMIKRNDAHRPRSVFDGDFSSTSIVDFVTSNSLPSFGELTPINLPLYHKHGRPLLIAFRASAVNDNTYSPIVEKLTNDDSLRDKIFFTWMSLSSSDVNEVILQSYTGKKEVPVLIIVSHKKGLIYHYKNEVSLNSVIDWIKRCISGEENPSNKLKEGKWEPLLEGYNYLAMMDKDEEEKAKKVKKSEDDEDYDFFGGEDGDNKEQTGTPIEKARQRKPEDFREDDEKRHDEL